MRHCEVLLLLGIRGISGESVVARCIKFPIPFYSIRIPSKFVCQEVGMKLKMVETTTSWDWREKHDIVINKLRDKKAAQE